LVDENRDSLEYPTARLDQVARRDGLAAPFNPVIDEQHPITRSNRRVLDLQDVALSPVVGSGFDLMFHSGKQAALFTYRDEADSECIRRSTSKDEPSGLDSADPGDRDVPPRRDQRCDHVPEGLTVVEYAPDIRVSILPSEATEKGLSACYVFSTHADMIARSALAFASDSRAPNNSATERQSGVSRYGCRSS
jgi:hypothetical protein